MTKIERNTRAVELWLQNRSWRSIAHHLEAEGFGAVSHQYVSRVVKRELQRAWEGTRSPLAAAMATTLAEQRPELVRVASRMETAPSLASNDHEVAPQKPRTGQGSQLEMQVESFFSARHFVVMGDNAGTPHHHSYRIGLKISGEIDERTGVAIGFAEALQALENAIQPYAEAFLNTLDQFDRDQPTTENLAHFIMERVKSELASQPCSPTQLTLWESPTKGVTLSAA